MDLPSGLKATTCICSAPLMNVRTSRRASTSQSFIPPSLPAVANHARSSDIATLSMWITV
jgi:hypothetical protein